MLGARLGSFVGSFVAFLAAICWGMTAHGAEEHQQVRPKATVPSTRKVLQLSTRPPLTTSFADTLSPLLSREGPVNTSSPGYEGPKTTIAMGTCLLTALERDKYAEFQKQ